MRELIVRKIEGAKKKYCFPWLEEDNIYKSYAPLEKEIVFHFFWEITYKK